jgi:transposase
LGHAEEIAGNVALTWCYYGISRQVFYKWRRRFDELGLEGLRDWSSRPRVCPNATRTEVVGKIIYLRQTYHFGPAKIAMYLKRYHDIQISHSGVWQVLKRLDLNRLPASQRSKRHDRRWKRYEKPLPGHRVQIDVKFIAPLSGSRRKHYQFTAIDDCTRLRVLRIYPPAQQEDRDPVRRLRAGAPAVPGGGHPDRQRYRVPVPVPLRRAGQGHRPRLHQAQDTAAHWQGRALSPDRR